MLNCKNATRLMSEAMERKLGLKERMELNVHTMICDGCRNYGHQMKTIGEVAKAYAAGIPEPMGVDDPDEPSSGDDK